MSFDPNSDQQEQGPDSLEQAPEQQEQSPLMPPDAFPQGEDTASLPEESPQEAPQPTQAGGAFASLDAPEEDAPISYRGRFAAPPASDEAAEPIEDSLPQPEYPEESTEESAPAQDTPEEIPAPQEPVYDNAFPTPEDFPEPEAAIPAPAPQPERRRTRAVKKGRPRRRKGEGLLGIPNILATGVWVVLTLLTSVTLGRMAWVCASEILAFGREDKVITITVYETDTIDDITRKLARSELIHYPGLFKLYASFAVDDGDIKPGIWDLNTKYDYHALVKMMSPSSSRDVVKVMIPEGYSCRQIFALLQENKVCTIQDIESYAATGELNDYWFLDGVARGDRYCLEGFLFPDTYEFYQNDSPKSILTKMLNNFNTRFDETMRGKIQTLNNHLSDLMRRDGKAQDYIDSHLFTVRDVVNVASMIEKETSSAEEGYTIASVIYNRLFYWHGNPAYLNIDATIIYALDGKTDLTAEDLRVNSPYNTYTNIGLTPGPIANPGLTSLQAALEPTDTNYYYYVLDPTTGTHVFSTTQEEHEANRVRLGG